MKIVVRKPGLQTTIQSGPRIGSRHLGVPASGAADPLSMALANRLVDNEALAPALETSLTGVTIEFTSSTFVAVTGAIARSTLNGEKIKPHCTIAVREADVLQVGAAEKGVRSYIAFAGGLAADEVLGSSSTYMTAGLGGHLGRAFREGDELSLRDPARSSTLQETPTEFCIPMLDAWSLRVGRSCESDALEDAASLFASKLIVGSRCDRMGIKLEGRQFRTNAGAQMPSAPMFPGMIQCPQDGNLFVMSVDSGTTGGYPRVAKITRMDLHVLGQLRPGDSLRFIERDDGDAASELHDKHAYWSPWLPDIADVI